MSSMHSILSCAIPAIALLAALPAVACDTWVALRNATADRSVILAKNSDRPPMEAQPLVHIPRAKHVLGEKLKCTYIEIPQAAETYEHLGSRIWWAFGYEHGMNEHGVAIGNEAVWSKEPYQWGDGLLGMDLLRLGLERGKSAHEALRVIVSMIEKYGQCGDAERAGEWGKANYHNSFLIADPKEAWVLETAGRYWVAKRISEGVYSISNIYSIEKEWDEAHPKLVEHAIEMGWSKSAKSFNFARDYGAYWDKQPSNPGNMQIRRNTTMSCLRRDSEHITPASMMKLSRNHLEGTIAESRWAAAETFWPTPCMHDSARTSYHSVASMIAHLRDGLDPLLRQVYWSSFSNPCSNVFKPFYLNGPVTPAGFAQGTSTYSADSPWWWANRVKLLCDLNYRALSPDVRSTFDATEQWEIDRQKQVEDEVRVLLKAGKKTDAVSLLQRFIGENSARVEREYRTFNDSLPAKLKSAEVEYLFVDYLKDWTSKARVPLPLP